MAKKMKKLFSLILALSMVMSLMSVMASAEGLQYGCGNEEHSHGEACYELQLQCEKHVHGEACYTQESSLTCEEDHEHAEECSTVTNVLTCTEEDHTHDDACYVSVLTCTKEEHTHSEECVVLVAKIGDVEYKTLSAAVAAANADTATEGAVVIELIGNTVFDSAMTISRAITIIGAKTITRAEGYTGKLFTVASGATLTLDGGVIIDGGNNWYFAEESFYADMAAGKTLSSGAKKSYTESNGTASTAAMIAINGGGAVVMNSATIRNNWGSPLFSIPAKASLTMNDGSLISHIRSGNGGAVAGQLSGTWTMNGGKIEGVHGHSTNGGLVDVRGGVVTINGGEITDITTLGLNANGNGILAQVYGESSKMNINGGHIHGNASFAPGGGWGAVVYLNRGGDFTMTDGVIEDTVTDKCTAFVANAPTSIELLGGTIEVDPNTVDNFDSLIYGNVVMAEGMQLISNDTVVTCLLGDAGNTLDIDGTISGGTIWLMYNEPVTGDGTITSDVLIKADPSYFEHNGKVTIAEGNWIDSVITVNSIGLDTTLTVAEGAYINGKQIRVLDSVASGNYLDAEEAAAAQAASYVNEQADGKNVKSPVLYFHRLTSAQKNNIVVTYDYNGGIDAQGWSGCQKTSEEGATSYAHGTLPAPTRDGYTLIGWKYAVDNAPESLDMTGSEWLAEGAEETASVRLIAQWGYTVTYTDGVEGEEVFADKVFTEIVPGTATPAFTAPAREGYTFAGWTPAVEATVNGDALYTATWEVKTVTSKPQLPAGDVEEEFPEEEVPTTDAPVVEEEEIFEEEDVPMADVPETGDPTALWAAMSVVSAAGILFIGKKNKDEE